MKYKKLILSMATFAATAAPVSIAVSCGTKPTDAKSYTVGFAINPITSLNYIKYTNSVPFAHSLVESIAKGGPTVNSSLKNYLTKLQKPFIYSGRYHTQDLSIYSIYSGALRASDSPSNHVWGMQSFETKEGKGKIFDMNLNGVSTWQNGDKLISSDFVDFITYVLDLNSGSQLISKILELGIQSSAEFIDAQTEYAKAFGVLYKNPFGYIQNVDYTEGDTTIPKYVQTTEKFKLQQTDSKKVQEQVIVDKIQAAARNLGIFGGEWSSHPFTHTGNFASLKKEIQDSANGTLFDLNDDINMVDKEKYQVHKKVKDQEKVYSPYKIRFVTSLDKTSYDYVINKLVRSKIMPINRKFVESHGGVEAFGLSTSSFLTEGSFKIKELTLGNGGGATLEKDYGYYDSPNIIPESVKLYFQSDNLIKSSLFEDGYISSTDLTAITAKKFYSDTKYRNMIRKQAGQGTTGLIFNLDPNSEKYNEALSDTNLRKAIFYAINREEIIKLSGYDATLPSYALSDAGAAGLAYSWLAPSNGVTFAQAYNDAEYTNNRGDVDRLYPWNIQAFASSGTLLGNVDKTDVMQNLDAARYYFEKFKADRRAAGKSENVSIEYTYDSTKQLLNTGIAIQTQLKAAFGSELTLDIKGYPKSIYDSFYAAGKFQMTYRNLDYLGSSKGQSTDAFFVEDSISNEEQKLSGFISNPSGAWTYSNVFDQFKNGGTIDGETQLEFMKRMGASIQDWNKLKDLIKEPTSGTIEERLTVKKRKIKAFFGASEYKDELGKINGVDKNYDTQIEISKIPLILNRIIMDQSPVIPTFVVDIKMFISRMSGFSYTDAGGNYNFDYGYDLVRRPRPDLPGLEALDG